MRPICFQCMCVCLHTNCFQNFIHILTDFIIPYLCVCTHIDKVLLHITQNCLFRFSHCLKVDTIEHVRQDNKALHITN